MKNLTINHFVEYAKKYRLFNNDKDRHETVIKLFTEIKSNDFEMILRMLFQARNINKIVGTLYHKLDWAYLDVRQGLIQAIRSIHPEYNNVLSSLIDMGKFIKNFKTILSLNYDLLVYWILMLANEDKTHQVKDCFISSNFNEKWKELRKPINGAKNTTLVFYPHGNLILLRDVKGFETKISNHGLKNENLLNSILKIWGEENGTTPLFISEGTSEQKVRAIKNSRYLSIVYEEVIPEEKDTLVIYGWGVGEQDVHILRQLKDCKLEKVAISVYERNEKYCHHVKSMLEKELTDTINIDFFDSQSIGCWNN